MGWNFAGLLAESVLAEAAVSALPGRIRPTGARLPGYEALGTGRGIDYAIAQLGTWTVIADPHLRLVQFEAGAELSRGGRCLAFVVSDVSTTYGFWLWAEGEIRRRVVYSEGELLEEHGEPLAEEAGLPDPAVEDYVLELVERVTGLGLTELLDAEYQELGRRRGLFGR